MTGRSILSAAMRTRVATRSGGNDGLAGGGPPEPSGGSVMRGLGVALIDGAGGGGRGRRRQRIGGDRRGERQDARGQEGDAERRQERRNDSRADAIRERTHGSGMVAAVPAERRRPLVLVPSARHESTPVDRRRPGGRCRRRGAGARGAPGVRPRSAAAGDAEPADRRSRPRARRPSRRLAERLAESAAQRRGRSTSASRRRRWSCPRSAAGRSISRACRASRSGSTSWRRGARPARTSSR